MAQYTKSTGANGTVRYKDGGQFVGKADIPQNIKDALDANPEGTIIDELAQVVDPSTESDEGSEDEQLPTKPTETESSEAVEGSDQEGAPAPEANTEESSDEGDEDGEPEQPEEPTTPEPTAPAPAPKPARRSNAKTEIGGMGFPAKGGKTLSIFSDVPHETVKNISGIMVPLTHKEFVEKSDGEIIIRLQELGKI